ncbi:PAS domain-containing sensor histidine kinase [Roseomonas genomospecies 6]|uniref:histidine kinase n=1 Tax=Roseomonas genomospecies 6 TaxID=214106 RepID=A0A9W7NNW6_9PROT|nr:PAS domain-containing sensor histidine kinase [Roseomonas genomospecies 6]KAA0683965.1 PAS domain-containing sensor histidine kinase [Roseomonas genomospecies 6]
MSPTPPETATPLWQQFLRWATRVGLAKRLAFALSLAALAAGFATYTALTESAPFGETNPRTVTLLLTLDLALLLLLGVLIARRIVYLWIGRRRGLAGSQMHVRLVAVFSLLAIAPAIIMAIFSTVFFYVGVQSWFSERVRTAVNESLAVASAYLHEHQQNIRADALAMANDLNQEAARLASDPERFEQVVATQAMLRALSEAIVFNGTTGAIVARSGYTFALEFDPIPDDKLATARHGEVAMIVSENDDRVRALVRLDRFADTYLYVGRMVEPRVLSHMASAEGAVREFGALESQRGSLQITFTLIFLVVALLLLLAAVWAGLIFATRLARPISALIGAAERVRAGDLTVRVTEPPGEDELGLLSRAFNRMTTEIESQRHELLSANRLIDERRRFTETVLGGVSAGVIGLNAEGRITLPNFSAARLLGVDDAESMIGVKLADLSPEMGELLAHAPGRPGRVVQDQIQIRRPGTTPLTLLVRISTEGRGSGEIRGYVVTFDDITELVSAQRKAAWADVARRIAHEIKNPLTPIQLSAERLRRKYLKEITSDTEVFTMCTDTIVRQVDDIRRMVDEFSAFARMPQPVMKPCNLNDLVRQAVFLQSSAHAGKIKFEMELPPGPLTVPCDSRQISQALTNLLQNAADAIEGRPPATDGAELPPGHVSIRIQADAERIAMIVEDNGKGLPTEERDRLTEPYVTTRAKGTGLGLAIVKKIMEDHGGVLTLEDRESGGARVGLVIPNTSTTTGIAAGEAPGGVGTPAETGGEKRHAAHGA